MNFGKIDNAFKEILIEGILRNDNNKKSLYRKYIKLLKENDILKTQYLIYRNLKNNTEVTSDNSIDYINENISLVNDSKRKKINEVNKKLTNLIKNKKLLDIDYENKKIDEHISNLIHNKKNASNIMNIAASKLVINAHILNNKKDKNISESATLPTSVLSKISMKKFNEKYKNLDETTKKAISIITENDEDKTKTFYNELKKECTLLVNESLKNANGDLKEKLLEVKEHILNLEYKEDKGLNDIKKIINLKNTLTT